MITAEDSFRLRSYIIGAKDELPRLREEFEAWHNARIYQQSLGPFARFVVVLYPLGRKDLTDDEFVCEGMIK